MRLQHRLSLNMKTDICSIFRFEFWYRPLWGVWLFCASRRCPIVVPLFLCVEFCFFGSIFFQFFFIFCQFFYCKKNQSYFFCIFCHIVSSHAFPMRWVVNFVDEFAHVSGWALTGPNGLNLKIWQKWSFLESKELWLTASGARWLRG